MGKQPTAGKKTKESIAKAAASRGKSEKKKWTKGKVKDKINNGVYLDKNQFENLKKTITKCGKYISVTNVSQQFKVNGSVARCIIKSMKEQGTIKAAQHHSKQLIYSLA